jgi:hypothetical protein
MIEELVRRWQSGGVPMYMILAFGAPLVAAAVRYAWAPTPPRLRTVVLLGALTGAAGALGLVTGLAVCFEAIAPVKPMDMIILGVNGAAEALMNPAFALILILMAGVAATVGSVRARAAAA